MNPASELGHVEPVDSSYYSNMKPRDGEEHNNNSKPVSSMKRENNSTLTEHGNQNGRRKTVTFEARLSRIPVLDPVALPMAQPRQRYVPSFEHQSRQEMVKSAANTPPAFYVATGNSMHNQPGHAQSAEYSFNEHNRHKIWKALLPHRPPEHGFDPVCIVLSPAFHGLYEGI